MSDIIQITDPITALELGRCIELRRISAGLSQKELAGLVGLPKHHIDNWEAGRGLLQTTKVFAAFEACGCIVRIAPSETLKALLRRQG